MSHEVDVVVVGGGPAGLAAATRLRERGVARVLVIEREAQAGGVPRHCVHPGFGLRDLHRSLSGPRYAGELVRRALVHGVEILTSATVTDVDAAGVSLTSMSGTRRIDARAIVVATGARERPRAARHVAGDRPAGIFTTGQLQQWTYVEKLPVGRRALVVGAEHVSFSALMTLRHAGVATVAMATELAHHQSVGGAGLFARAYARAPLHTSARVLEIRGRRRVESVVLEHVHSGRTWVETVDTVVFTGDWIPDHELVRRGGVVMDPGTLGPSSDAAGRTSIETLYAAGNLMHPVESADVAARGAREVADAVAAELVHRPGGTQPWVTLRCEGPLQWIWPNRIMEGHTPPLLRVRTKDFTAARTLEAVSVEGRVAVSDTLRRTTPHRSLRAPHGIVTALGHGGIEIVRLV